MSALPRPQNEDVHHDVGFEIESLRERVEVVAVTYEQALVR
jgi:hypothetical protein